MKHDTLPCGWTLSWSDEALYAYRIGEGLPLRLNADATALERVRGADPVDPADGTAAAAHLVAFHSEDPRVAAVEPVDVRNPMARWPVPLPDSRPVGRGFWGRW